MKILITGATHGMGKGVAKVLASINNHAHEIIILCRARELGVAIIKELESVTLNKNISIVMCDLSKLSEVKKAIYEIQIKHSFLDGIFINAGLGYAAKRIQTEDGMDSHFQVNYLSQFMLVINLFNLLEKSENGGRIIFNVTQGGKIYWEDMQMKNNWEYESGIHQAMVAKRMFLAKLHRINTAKKDSKLSFIGFQIPKTVWTNQISKIPFYMKMMATIMKLFGTFISIDKCEEIMAPLFVEDKSESMKKSGKFITWKNGEFVEIYEDIDVLNPELQDKLWNTSLDLCKDDQTNNISRLLHS